MGGRASRARPRPLPGQDPARFGHGPTLQPDRHHGYGGGTGPATHCLLAAAEDSFDFSALLSGTHDASPIRAFALHQTNSLALALRRGAWKFLDHAGSGGNDYTRPLLVDFALDDGAPRAPAQLFHLASDPGETRNLLYEQAGTARRLKAELEGFKAAGRSAPER